MNKEKTVKFAKKAYYTVKNCIAGAIITAALLCIFVTAAGDNYVTSDDPLVSLSYVEKLRAEIKSEVKAEVRAEMQTQISELVKEEVAKQINSGVGGGTADYSFVTVTLQAGEKLMAKSSCELLVRSGSCKAITPSSSQALIDKTNDTSIQNGADVVKNHLISIPKADGRGVIAIWSGTEIIIRGEYEIVS